MCIFHKWGKWEQYDVTTPRVILTKNWALEKATDHMQKKKCNKCGKVSISWIGQTVNH